MKLDKDTIWEIAKKEAKLGVSSKAVWGVLSVVLIGAVTLIGFVGAKIEHDTVTDLETLVLILGTFLTVVMGMGILMNSTIVGGSISEEKDKKVVEILLSLARPEELYIGKMLGHSLIGFTQLVILWATVLVFTLVFDISTLSKLPLWFCFVMLAFMLLAYLLFTALYALAGALVSNVEDYSVAQIPIVFLFMASMFLPFAPIIGWGSLNEGWVPFASWIPPLSMTLAPTLDAFGDGLWIRTISSFVIFFVEISILNYLGTNIFRKKVLK